MRNRCVALFSLLAVLAACPLVARAADHGDGSGVLAQPDPSVDINDLFVWMNSDATRVNAVMTVYPNAPADAAFSDAVSYVFRFASYPDFATGVGLTPGDPFKTVQVICNFDAQQNISCWVVDGTTVVDYVTGNASDPAGITSKSGATRVFAGLRNDPFFFNLAGFRNATTTVASVAGGLQLDGAGCPQLDQQTAGSVAGLLSMDCTGQNPPVDFFDQMQPGANDACEGDFVINQGLTGNILAIAIQLDKSLLVDAANPTLAAWASTHQ